MKEEGGSADVGQNRPAGRDFFSLAGSHSLYPTPCNNLDYARIELNLATGFFKTAEQRLCKRTGSALRHHEAGRGRQERQHETEPGPGQVVWAQVDVQR